MYQTQSVTQTATQAKRLASRIGAELMQMQALYGEPSDRQINEFVLEAEYYLAAKVLQSVQYGFKRNGKVVFDLFYTEAGATALNDKPGRVPPDADVSGASWFSYLIKNSAWEKLSALERQALLDKVPVKRSDAPEPVLDARLRNAGSKQFSEDTMGLRREARTL